MSRSPLDHNLLHIRRLCVASPEYRIARELAKPAERIAQSGGLVKSCALDRPWVLGRGQAVRRAEAMRLAMSPAMAPAPTPLSMLTTAMPGAQV